MWSSLIACDLAAERDRRIGAVHLTRGLLEPFVEILVRGRLAGDRELAVADEVEEDHRLDLAERRRALSARLVRCVLDVLPRAARAVLFEGTVAARLLGVEECERDGRTVERRLGGEDAGELQHDGDARGAIVGAHEVRDVLRVVVRTDDDRALARARDRRHHVAVRALHLDVLGARLAQAILDQGHRLGALLGPGRPGTDLNLGLQILERAVGIEALLERARRNRHRRSRRSRAPAARGKSARSIERG